MERVVAKNDASSITTLSAWSVTVCPNVSVVSSQDRHMKTVNANNKVEK